MTDPERERYLQVIRNQRDMMKALRAENRRLMEKVNTVLMGARRPIPVRPRQPAPPPPQKLKWPQWSRTFTCPGCRRQSVRVFSGAVAMPELFCSDECQMKVHAWRDEKRHEIRERRDDEFLATGHR